MSRGGVETADVKLKVGCDIYRVQWCHSIQGFKGDGQVTLGDSCGARFIILRVLRRWGWGVTLGGSCEAGLRRALLCC